MKGGTGAPLEADELEEIEKAFPSAKRFLPKEHLAVIQEEGLWKYHLGTPVTPCIDDHACVFVTYEDAIAKCAFEKAFLLGESTWQKPLSCHLFPVRVDRGGIDRLRFEFIEECRPALGHGAKTSTKALDFVREALVRAFGDEWWSRLRAVRATTGDQASESLLVESK